MSFSLQWEKFMVCKLYPSQLLKIKMCPVIEMKQKFVELLEHKKSPSQGFNVDNRLPIRHTQHADAKTLPVEGGGVKRHCSA